MENYISIEGKTLLADIDDNKLSERKIPCKLSIYRGFFCHLAVRTGLEPATLGVTGRYSNQLNYRTELASF